MARGTQLTVLIDKVRYECRHSSNLSSNPQTRDHIKHLLQRTQEMLYDSYDWPFANIHRDIATTAGQRYYNFHADLPLENVTDAHARWGNDWLPLLYGITPAHYSAYDSDAGIRADPVQAWAPYDNQFEIWPIPQSNGTLRMRGRKKLAALVADADTAVLDDQLLVLSVAAELLKAQDAKDAADKQTAADRRLRYLRTRLGGEKRAPFVLGGGNPDGRSRPRPGIDYIP